MRSSRAVRPGATEDTAAGAATRTMGITGTVTVTTITAATATATPRRLELVRRHHLLRRTALPPRLQTTQLTTRSTTAPIRMHPTVATKRTSKCTSSGWLLRHRPARPDSSRAELLLLLLPPPRLLVHRPPHHRPRARLRRRRRRRLHRQHPRPLPRRVARRAPEVLEDTAQYVLPSSIAFSNG